MYIVKQVSTLRGFNEVLDVYTVDRNGIIYNQSKSLKQQDNGNGYKLVSLKVKGKRKWKKCYVHRLVASAFIDNPNNLPEVNHKDENKANNQVSNLEWCERLYNCNYGTSKNRISKSNGTKCYLYDYRLNYIGEFDSVKKAQEHTGIDLKLNSKTKGYFLLEDNNLKAIPKIVKKTKATSIVITNTLTGEKHYFYSNREARRYFNNKINITQAIQNNWTIAGKYKVRILNYKKLIDSLDL